MNYGLKQYIFVIRELTVREIKRKYSRSILGILWSVLHPLLFMVIMSIVFSGFSDKKTLYPVYYLTGYTIWSMFNVATMTSMSVLEDNKTLLSKTKLPREVFILSRNYTAFVNLLFSTVALIMVLIFFKVHVDWTVVFYIIAALSEALFTIGVSFFISTIYVFYKDIRFIWKNILIVIVHMIAIYIPIERYPKNLEGITRKNPLFIFADVARRSILENSFDVVEVRSMLIWSISVFLLGLLFFKSKEDAIINKV